MTSHKIAYLFPGQGSQYRGIGKDLYDQHQIVKDTYQEASDALGYDVTKLSFEDPKGEINLTRYTQPVLLTHSTACHRLFIAQLKSDQPSSDIAPALTAGHSLGEYSALVAAGGLSFELGLQLVKTRGELMGEFGEGEMQALMLDLESATQLAEQHYCGIAACNLPEQNVVGGRASDLDALTATMAEKFPRKRSARLKTEGAFHTYYMVEAARRFREVLDNAHISQPAVKVLSNFTGDVHDDDLESIKSRLFMQLFNPVLWHRNLITAGQAGINLMIEFGGGLGKGESPAEMRPNLEGIVKKAFKGEENPPAYLSVINLASLEESVAYFRD